MTVADALREAAHKLSSTSDTARLDTEILMAHALRVSRSDMLLRHMTDEAPAGFAALLERRLGHEPVAYITGVQEFYGREFCVTPDVLIPRGDSESVVEAALLKAPNPGRILDLGTGSGALLITMLAETEASGLGIDQSSAAIAVTQTNAERLGVADRAQLRVADWSVPGWSEGSGRYDLIISNPPYVERDAVLEPDVRKFEPASALFAGDKGLDDYWRIIPQLCALLTPDGIAVLEIGADQAPAVSSIAETEGFDVEIVRDLAGCDRALILT